MEIFYLTICLFNKHVLTIFNVLNAVFNARDTVICNNVHNKAIKTDMGNLENHEVINAQKT